ncbi:MAG: conjugal transfer protein TraO [Prevotellaceae bacterium]|jgi:hypothetical protein|nr:conjugal transfer protein TraO [Prevotellaceae bacterium]
MKKSKIILLIALCLAVCSQAQAQRCLPGQKGILFTAGAVNSLKSDFHGGIAYSVYTKNANYWVFGSEYLEKRFSYKNLSLPQTQFTVEAGYYLNFLSNGSKTLFFSLGLSAMAGYETVNWDKKRLFDGATIQNKDGFLYGGALALETEIYLTDWLVLLVNVRERLLGGSSVGLFNTQPGVGLKFIIN